MMTTRWKQAGWTAALIALTVPAAAHGGRSGPSPGEHAPRHEAAPLLEEASSGVMRIGLTIVPARSVRPLDAPPPDPASLAYPASPNAVLCHGDDRGYRECLTPFRGRVAVSREVSATRCIEHRNWGWREGAVWVDQGCGAVFVRVVAD